MIAGKYRVSGSDRFRSQFHTVASVTPIRSAASRCRRPRSNRRWRTWKDRAILLTHLAIARRPGFDVPPSQRRDQRCSRLRCLLARPTIAPSPKRLSKPYVKAPRKHSDIHQVRMFSGLFVRGTPADVSVRRAASPIIPPECWSAYPLALVCPSPLG